jgi:hypothetical protein
VSRPADPAPARTDTLSVRGGSGGIAVGLDELDAALVVLLLVVRETVEIGLMALAAAADVDVVAGTVLSGATGMAASAGLLELAGPAGLTGAAEEMVATAGSVRAAVSAYRAAEAAVATALELAQDELMFLAGSLAPQLLVGLLALDALGADAGALLDRAAFEHPGIADLAGGAEGLLLGLQANPLTAPLVTDRPAPVRPRSTAGEAEVDLDYEHGVQALADSAAAWGLLDDTGRAHVVAEPAPRAGARAPRSLRDLAADQRNLGAGERYPGHVRVIEVPQPHGSVWVVEISGTQDWSLRAGATPFDVTTDVRSMAQEATVLAEGVQQALAQAQAASDHAASDHAASDHAASDHAAAPGRATAGGPSAPVMLVGHSLGGIAAAGLASSPRFTAEHQVTHLVTMGAPVGRMPVPAETQVLSLEHTRDPVPRLEGQRNPDRATWVTVTRDAHGDGVDRATQTHDLRGYVDTAAIVDESTDSSLATWRSTSATFFAGDAHGEPVIRDYLIRRVRP